MSRGIWLAMGARSRRSLTLLWTALFVLSLGLQYASFAAPATTQAYVGTSASSPFELDGNAFHSSGHDWDQVYADRNGPPYPTSGAGHVVFATDPTGQGDDILTGGGTKDVNDLSQWLWKQSSSTSVQDKNDIEHAFAAAYTTPNGHRIAYFGLDRYSIDGDATAGFWFFKNGVAKAGNGGGNGTGFTGVHAEGDVLVVMDFSNGGSNGNATVFEWKSGALVNTGTTGGNCAPGTSQTVCAITNIVDANSPWAFTPKSGTANVFPAAPVKGTAQGAGAFYEGGLDMTALGLDDSCYASFMAETRSSTTPDSTLSDFVLGQFSFCNPPTITTSVSASTINVGESVTDTADLTGNTPTPAGKIDFYVCGPSAQAPDCSTGGTKVGATKTLSGGKATSDAFTVSDPKATGTYCFRAEYTPTGDSLSKYLPGSHTNKTTECFQVIPAGIDVTKSPDKASVNAGEQIGFVVGIKSTGPGTAAGVKVTDTLPSTPGTSWTIDAAGTTGAWSLVGNSLTFGGANGVSMPKDAEYHVHVVSPTTAASCGKVDNTASGTTTNDGTDSASASVTVNCPDIKVTKTPDNGSVQAGDPAVFTIVVENIGAGTAKGVTLTDTLPTGYTWTPSTDTGSCSVTSGVLSCSLGDMAAGAKATITLTAPTSGAKCAAIPNTASASATNEAASATGNNSDSGSINVLCAQIDITKTANPAGPVSAGDTIGFDIVVANTGAGEARNVTVTDTLPTTAGTSWSVSPAVAGCSITSGVLTCNLGTLAAGASKTIHLTSGTTAASCSVVNNTASVTTSNDGSDSSSASVTVLCPDVKVTKTATPAGPVSAGDTIGFQVVVQNIGQGVAKNVTLNDPLPSGVAWAIDPAVAGCSITSGVLSCSFGDLAAGASKTINISGKTDAADCGTVTNTATVAATYDTNPGNNSSTASVVVNCPDVKVIKVADQTPVSAGEMASFSIEVSNLGPGTAYDVTLNDPLPAGVAWALDAPVAGCSIASNTLTCSFAQLLPGVDNTVFIHIAGETDAADCGVLPNTATVAASNEPSGKTGNNTSSASIAVNCPTLVITKTAVPAGPVSAGDTIGFRVDIANTGAGSAFNVSVDDVLPAGFSWAIDAANSSTGWSISSGHLRYGPATLASKATSTVLIKAATTPAACGVVNNVATIYQAGTPQGNDDASVVVDCPDVKVTKTADKASYDAGDTIGFSILVQNLGPGLARGVTLSDTLPAGFTWTLDPAVTGCTIASGVLGCAFGDMAAGASRTVHVSAVSAAANCGRVNNTAVVDATNEPNTDQYTANNTSSAGLDVLCAAIDVTKTADAASVSAGAPIGFTVTLANTGQGTAKGIVFTDPLPAGNGVSWSISPASAGWSISGSAPNQTLVFSPTTLAAGASTSVHVTSATTAASCKVYDNTASVTTSNDGSDTASASTQVVCPDITVTKTADEGTFYTGDQIGFTVTIKNAGVGAAKGAWASDPLPGSGWSISPASAGWSITEGTLTFKGDLAAGASSSVHVVRDSDAEDCGTVTNTVTVGATNEPAAKVDEGNSATASLEVLCPVLTIDKSNDAPLVSIGEGIPPLPTLKEGESATFTLAYTLTDGPVTNGVITDVLPAGLTYVDGSASSNDEFTFVGYDAATRTLTWTADTVTKNGTLTYKATADKGASDLAQPLVNVASIVSDQTPKDSDDSNVYVPAPPKGETSSPTPPPSDTLDTPQDSNPGFSLMLVLLALAGFALALGFVTPAPERVRRRDRDS